MIAMAIFICLLNSAVEHMLDGSDVAAGPEELLLRTRGEPVPESVSPTAAFATLLFAVSALEPLASVPEGLPSAAVGGDVAATTRGVAFDSAVGEDCTEGTEALADSSVATAAPLRFAAWHSRGGQLELRQGSRTGSVNPAGPRCKNVFLTERLGDTSKEASVRFIVGGSTKGK
jgi:hypothetical protein